MRKCSMLPSPVLHAVSLSPMRVEDQGEEELEEAEKHADRCEALAALMVVAKGKLEQARATVAERATAA